MTHRHTPFCLALILAVAAGLSISSMKNFFNGAARDRAVLKEDRNQAMFRNTLLEFTQSLICKNRIQNGALASANYDTVFAPVQKEFAVSWGILLAYEADFGPAKGDFNTRGALPTAAHDCRRPQMFQPQVFAAIQRATLGNMDPATTKRAWASEIDMLHSGILERGMDDDCGRLLSLKTWAADALLSALVPLPQSRNGRAFLAYPNHRVLFDWNKSFVYVTTAAYFATCKEGASPNNLGTPNTGLERDRMNATQKKLFNREHGVGAIDAVLGAAAGNADQIEQARLELPADAWSAIALPNPL